MMGAKKKLRAQIISADILSDCQLGPISPELAFLAMVQATGHYLANIETRMPDAVESYMNVLRANLKAAQP